MGAERQLPCNADLRVTPDRGVLAPGEAVIVALRLAAKSPEVFELDFRCQVAPQLADPQDDNDDVRRTRENISAIRVVAGWSYEY